MKLIASEVVADLRAAGSVQAQGCGPEVIFDGVCTDTRQDPAKTLFFALRGEHFDAHDFVLQALAAGARGVVVSTARAAVVPAGNHAVILVADPLAALQQLAQASLVRRRPRVIAITGSNGKTTTKDLTVAALGALGRVHGTRGNLNNHIGVPLTVLSRRGDEDFLVVEAGANDFGELDLISRLVTPDVVVITNIGRAHLERFGSEAGVLRAKSEILNGLATAGHAVLNADDPKFAELTGRAGAGRTVSFGFAAGADYRIESQRTLSAEAQEIVVRGVHCTVPRPGRGNALNAAAALAVAGTLGGDLHAAAAAIATCRFTAQRSAWTRAGDCMVLDDTYNANPDSMAQALDMLAAQPGRRIAVLGDMLELGSDAASLHAEVGRRAASSEVEQLLVVGPGMAHAATAAAAAGMGARARHFDDLESLVTALHALLRPGDAVLVKGSRGSRMERVVAALTAGVA